LADSIQENLFFNSVMSQLLLLSKESAALPEIQIQSRLTLSIISLTNIFANNKRLFEIPNTSAVQPLKNKETHFANLILHFTGIWKEELLLIEAGEKLIPLVNELLFISAPFCPPLINEVNRIEVKNKMNKIFTT
jgi:hypothetical protein